MKHGKLVAFLIIVALIVGAGAYLATRPPKPPTIKIGIIGPEGWIQGKGMKEAAKMAAEEINAGGGIKVWDEAENRWAYYQVEIVFADTLRGEPDPTAATGLMAAEELVDEGVDLVIGGFRTEAVFAAREVFMDHKIIYYIAGASTDELIDCGKPEPCAEGCVRHNYERYKYMFRVTPIPSTNLFYTIVGGVKYFAATQLLPKYGVPVKFAVLSEDLAWTETMHYLFTVAYPAILGENFKLVYQARVSPVAADLRAELTGIKDSGARLIIHILSAEVGYAFTRQWKELEVGAIPVGINVLSQMQETWDITGGGCEYETFLASVGTGTPIIPGRTDKFWNDYRARWGHYPIYTSWGVYDAIKTTKETIENIGRWPISSDELVPIIEETDRIGILGRFKYTEYHDVFQTPAEFGPTWPESEPGVPGWVRANFVQWQAGRMEVVYPVDQPYSKLFKLPPWMP